MPSNTNLFVDDTCLLYLVYNRDSSAAEVSNDFSKISHWTQHWKMSFNPAPSKQAQKVIFSKDSRHPLISNNFIGYEAMSQKHLGITLDNPLSFGEHLRLVFGKTDGTWVCYVNFNISSQDPHFLLCIKLLSDLILIMVTLYMNKLTINPFSRK